MRILLISSYTLSEVSRVDIAPPLSLLYVAAALREAGHDPVLFDLIPLIVPSGADRETFYRTAILREIRNVQPEAVGQNCFLSTHFSFVRLVAKMVKEYDATLPFIIGGIHPTLFAEDIIANCPEIDFIIRGEGELQTAALVTALAKNERHSWEKIPSIAYHNDAGGVTLTPRVSYVEPLDALPPPAWDLVLIDQYTTDHTHWYNPKNLAIRMSAPILTSRSCPFDCSFCSAHAMMGRGLRMHSPERVVDEIESLYTRYGINYFGFVDDNLTLNKKHIMTICNLIVKRRINIQFESFNGYNVASMDEDIVAAMCEAGCVYVIMPIEHGSDMMRNQIIGKKLPRDKIYVLANLYKKYHLLTRGIFIMGFPEETAETLDETYQMMLELDLDLYNVFTLIPFPGTRIFDQASRDNLLIANIDKTKLWEGTCQLNALHTEFFIQPYNCSLDVLARYRATFDALRINSDRARNLQLRSA